MITPEVDVVAPVYVSVAVANAGVRVTPVIARSAMIAVLVGTSELEVGSASRFREGV